MHVWITQLRVPDVASLYLVVDENVAGFSCANLQPTSHTSDFINPALVLESIHICRAIAPPAVVLDQAENPALHLDDGNQGNHFTIRRWCMHAVSSVGASSPKQRTCNQAETSLPRERQAPQASFKLFSDPIVKIRRTTESVF